MSVSEPLSDDELRAMLKACVPPKGATPAEALRHRRDEAMIRLMLESGVRAGEVVALQPDDVDLARLRVQLPRRPVAPRTDLNGATCQPLIRGLKLRRPRPDRLLRLSSPGAAAHEVGRQRVG